MARILYLEPFYGGSHRNFADNLQKHSSHRIDLHTMPSRFWKWRMRGAALYFYRLIEKPEQYDLLFLSGLMSLADLKSLWGSKCPPAVLYMHENQFSYPLSADSRIDYQFGFTDITSALNAERVLFNSNFHMNAFFTGLPVFLNRMPEFIPKWVPEKLAGKAEVVYPGVEPPAGNCTNEKQTGLPCIVWNHRWEFDKQPDVFFRAIDRLAREGINFRLSLLGENFQTVPAEFKTARKCHESRITHYGWLESRSEYFAALRKGSIVVSTAIQENFGISIAEAVLAGCIPLLPDRLVYPELLPASLHTQLLYNDEQDLYRKLKACILDPPGPDIRSTLISHYSRFRWDNQIDRYDRIFTITASENHKPANKDE
ncbi:MAG: DUF3524 domain-containing protein [Spirochaetales bacterium]|nr:DUF3524 domain-containing protein [Spirochaetales bacterium]